MRTHQRLARRHLERHPDRPRTGRSLPPTRPWPGTHRTRLDGTCNGCAARVDAAPPQWSRPGGPRSRARSERTSRGAAPTARSMRRPGHPCWAWSCRRCPSHLLGQISDTRKPSPEDRAVRRSTGPESATSCEQRRSHPRADPTLRSHRRTPSHRSACAFPVGPSARSRARGTPPGPGRCASSALSPAGTYFFRETQRVLGGPRRQRAWRAQDRRRPLASRADRLHRHRRLLPADPQSGSGAVDRPHRPGVPRSAAIGDDLGPRTITSEPLTRPCPSTTV